MFFLRNIKLEKMEVLMKKILLVVMDGVGYSKTGLGDAVTEANTPNLDRIF